MSHFWRTRDINRSFSKILLRFFFCLGSLIMLQYPKCAYGPYCKSNPIKNDLYILIEVSFYISTTWRLSLMVERGVPRAHVTKSYGLLRLICNVLSRASTFSVLKLIEILILWVYLHHPFWLQLVLVL